MATPFASLTVFSRDRSVSSKSMAANLNGSCFRLVEDDDFSERMPWYSL
jgi:hypothetical protein